MDSFGMPYTMIDVRNDEATAVAAAVSILAGIRGGETTNLHCSRTGN